MHSLSDTLLRNQAPFMDSDNLVAQIRLKQSKRSYIEANNSLSFTTFNSKFPHEQSTSKLNGAFVFSKLLIDHLLRIKPSEVDRNELICVCQQEYHNNNHEHANLLEFQRKYSCDQVLWWYTKDAFLYRMLNRALRVQDVHLLFLFRFVIHDLQEQLKKYQCTSRLTVYRGQYMTRDELALLKRAKRQLISINSFFSTTLDHQVALSFIPEATNRERVLFQIDADPQLDGIKPFADITSLGCFPREAEVLFMLGSIYRLDNIERNRDGVWIVWLTLCSDQDHDLKVLFDCLKNQYCKGESDLISFGNVLRDMAKLDEAEKYYFRQLEQLSYNNRRNIAVCFYSLGTVAIERGMYQSSLEWFQKSLAIEMQMLRSDNPALAATYNCIGNVYCKLGDDEKALESYNKALMISRQVLGEDHFRIANYLNNVGVVHFQKKNWLLALNYFEKALEIRQKHLPANHYWLGTSHNNIGIIYDALDQSDLALKRHDLSLEIFGKSLPPRHSVIGMTLYNKGTVYEKKGDLNEALVYYKKAADIYRDVLPPTHPYTIRTKKNIRRVLSQLK